MPRPRIAPDQSTYPGKVAESLYQLRTARKWTIDDVRRRLAEHDVAIPRSTLYAYERGRSGGGADLPLELVPVMAEIFGYKSATGWMP